MTLSMVETIIRISSQLLTNRISFQQELKIKKIYLRDATIQKFNSLRSRGDLDFQFHNLQLTRERSIDL